MATLATILRKFDRAAAEPRRRELAQTNPYLLRALPNEDIFFYTKRVDNSRLVREPDPRAKSECWSSIGAICAIAAGYQVEALKQERVRLLNERRGLDVEEAKLRGPERLEQLAKDQNMISPKPDQVVNLNMKASEGTVAFNTAGKE